MNDGLIKKTNFELELIWRDRKNPQYSKELIEEVYEELSIRGFSFLNDDLKEKTIRENFSHPQSYRTAFAGTLILATLYVLLHYVPIPTLYGIKEQLIANNSSCSILGLGLKPVIYAFLCVEIFSLVLKPLSRWRLEGSEGREKINQCAWFFSLALAFIQALGTSFLVKSFGGQYLWGLIPRTGFLFHLINISALMAGTYLGVWLARLISGLGIGNGFLILSLAIWLKDIGTGLVKQFVHFQKAHPEGNQWLSVDMMVILFVVTAVLLWKFIQRVPRIPVKGPNGKWFWFEISPFPMTLGSKTFAVALISEIGAFLDFEKRDSRWLWGDWSHSTIEVFLILVSGWFLYGWIWGEIDVFGLAVGNLKTYIQKRDKVLRKQFWVAMVVLVVGTVLFWARLGDKDIEPIFWMVGFVTLLSIFAVSKDLWSRRLFWRKHGRGVELLEMDNVHLADYVKGLFQREGIICHIQAYEYRRFFFWWAPLFKMGLWVPEEDAERALTLLATVQYQVI